MLQGDFLLLSGLFKLAIFCLLYVIKYIETIMPKSFDLGIIMNRYDQHPITDAGFFYRLETLIVA